MKLYCIARFIPKQGREDELKHKLQALIPATLKEKGCIQYVLTKNTEQEITEFVFNEIWETEHDFIAHNLTEQIETYFNDECIDTCGSVKEYKVDTYKEVE